MREVGIRSSELCLIKVGKINWNNGLYGQFWMDEHLVTGRGRGREIWPGLKTSRTKKKKENKVETEGRWVQMTPRAAEIAKKHAAGKTPDAYLFENPYTWSHYTPDALHRAFKAHGGAQGTTPHEA